MSRRSKGNAGNAVNVFIGDGQTVMQFTYMEFDRNWNREADHYKVALVDGASLLVVAEGSTGMRITYWFRVKKDQHVYIGGFNPHPNTVFIPSLCISARRGDWSSCGRNLEA